MASSNQARKRIRQNVKRNSLNKTTASSMRTFIKKVIAAVDEKDVAAARAALPTAIKGIDKAAKTHVIHANTAARKKSRIQRAVNSLA